jgi:hypothetical protein
MPPSVQFIYDFTNNGQFPSNFKYYTDSRLTAAIPGNPAYIKIEPGSVIAVPMTSGAPYIIKVAFFDSSNSPYNIDGSLLTGFEDINLEMTPYNSNTNRFTVVTASNVGISEEQTTTTVTVTNELSFLISAAPALPMIIRYVFRDSSGFFNFSSRPISFGNFNTTSKQKSAIDGDIIEVQVDLFNDNGSNPGVASPFVPPPTLSAEELDAFITDYFPLIATSGSINRVHRFSLANGDSYANPSIRFKVTNLVPIVPPNLEVIVLYSAILPYFPLSSSFPNALQDSSVTYNAAPVSPQVPCFLGNAPVLTPRGYERIDTLKKGNTIISTGGIVPITNVVSCNVQASSLTLPYVIPKGKYRAREDLAISPNHCIRVDDKMIPAKNLGLKQEKMEGSIKYYNIELEHWYNMFVAGVEVETLAPEKWVIVTKEQFNQAVKEQCGEMTDELKKTISSKVKFLDNGMVECPVFRRA